MVVAKGDAESPEPIDKVMVKGALFTCSYEEEVQAIMEATAWIRTQEKRAY